MRYQLRLHDQGLAAFSDELTAAVVNVLDALEGPPSREMVSSIGAAVREVLGRRIRANRFCGAAMSCQHSLPAGEQARAPKHEAYPGERVRVFLIAEGGTPSELIAELTGRALGAAAMHLPAGRFSKGTSGRVRDRLIRAVSERVFRSDACGESPLCDANEPADPWAPAS